MRYIFNFNDFQKRIIFLLLNYISGWIDWIENIITCPFCGEEFFALFCEDGNPKRKPVVITGLSAGKTKCPNCKKEIADDDIKK